MFEESRKVLKAEFMEEDVEQREVDPRKEEEMEGTEGKEGRGKGRKGGRGKGKKEGERKEEKEEAMEVDEEETRLMEEKQKGKYGRWRTNNAVVKKVNKRKRWKEIWRFSNREQNFK